MSIFEIKSFKYSRGKYRNVWICFRRQFKSAVLLLFLCRVLVLFFNLAQSKFFTKHVR